MAANEIHQDDFGTIFRATVLDGSTVVDISSATKREFVFNKPGTETDLTVTAALFTDGTDGIMQYTVASGDLDVGGNWCMQGKLTFTSSHWNTDIFKFKVHKNVSG